MAFLLFISLFVTNLIGGSQHDTIGLLGSREATHLVRYA